MQSTSVKTTQINTLTGLFLLITVSLISLPSIGQVSEVNSSLNKVRSEVQQVNYLANSHKIYQAVKELNNSKRSFGSYINNYFEQEFRAARQTNPDFYPQLRLTFSDRLKASYWESRVQQAQRSVDNARQALASGHHRRTLDRQDEVWAYLKTTYEIAKTIKDVAESVTQQEYIDAFENAKEGVDGFIENYKQIENAKLQILETQAYEMQIKTLISRGEHMEESNWQMASFMRAWEDEVDDYQNLVDYFNSRVEALSKEKSVDWSAAKFQWDGTRYLSQIKSLRNKFKTDNKTYEQVAEEIEFIINQANNSNDRAISAVNAVGTPEAVNRSSRLEDKFNTFNDQAFEILDECYRIAQNKNQNDIATTDKNDNNTQESGKTDSYTPSGKRVHNTYFNGYWIAKNGGERIKLFQNGNSVRTAYNHTGTVSGNSLIIVREDYQGKEITSTYQLTADGYSMRRVAVKEGEQSITDFTYGGSSAVAFGSDKDGDGIADEYDQCNDTPEGYTFNNGGVNLLGCMTEKNPSSDIALSSGESENAFDGSSSDISTSNSDVSSSQEKDTQSSTTPGTSGSGSSGNQDYQKKDPRFHDKRFSKGEVWTDTKGNGKYLAVKLSDMSGSDEIVFRPVSGTMEFVQVIERVEGGIWYTLYEGDRTSFKVSEFLDDLKPNATHLNFVVNSRHNSFRNSKPCRMELWVFPGEAKNKFDEYINKAASAFNKPYWEEDRGTRVSSNPKQETLDYLAKAKSEISKARDAEKRYQMVFRLSDEYSNYARRVFAYTAKDDFIKNAGSLLSTADKVSSDFSQRSHPNNYHKLRSSTYKGFAESWRTFAKAALWGDHQYNKMYCDEKSKSYYQKALQEDRSDVQLQKTIAEINRPKKPVPPEAEKLSKIQPETWNTAQNLMVQLNEGAVEPPKQPEENYMQVVDMVLEYSSGSVHIMRSGSNTWELAPKERVQIFTGDKIKTSHDISGAYVVYPQDNTKLMLKNNAEITFWGYDKLLISRGNAYLEVTKIGSEFLVITPTCAVGVRGTTFEVEVDASKETTTYLYEGVVEIRNNTHKSYLTPGQQLTAVNQDEDFKESRFHPTTRQASWKTPSPNVSHSRTTGSTTANNAQLRVHTETYQMSDATVGTKIGNTLQRGWTPVGLQTRSEPFDILYLNQDPFVITEWAIDWYSATDGNAVSNGITSKMQNEGFFPMGLSSANNRLYVLYAKGNMNATAWQLVESSQNLQQVSRDIDPYIRQGYIPVGISIYSQWYYTLLVKVENSTFKSWAIQGYNSKQQMEADLNNRLNSNQIPFGYLEEQGIYNVLYVGF